MTRQELEAELRARLVREYKLIRESQAAREAGEDCDPIEHAITVNGERIDFIQARLQQASV